MKISVTGATGFIGSHLIEALLEDGHKVVAIGRTRGARLPPAVQFLEWRSMDAEPPRDVFASADAVVHLAGEPVSQRWTPQVKQRIRSSRVDGTRNLVNALSKQSPRPRVLVCASAIGYYGSRGDEVLTETSGPGRDFLAQLVVDWEDAARQAEALGVRVALLRLGIVLGKDGGALAKMLFPFRLGLGGRLASGRQWMSWIHVDDVVGLIRFALENPAAGVPLNATAPQPVTNREFTRELAVALHRPAIFPVPGFALKLLFGEMGEVIFGSQRVIPKSAQDAGFQFQYPELRGALIQLLRG
jgi:uncharacterized protein (TIGR01777 family)